MKLYRIWFGSIIYSGAVVLAAKTEKRAQDIAQSIFGPGIVDSIESIADLDSKASEALFEPLQIEKDLI